jgi:3-oxoacyl-[acyl-carrier protein] reductase
MPALEGKVALVTGASRGLGRAIAIALAEAGADIAINYQQAAGPAKEVERSVQALGRRALLVQADVSEATEVSRMVEAVERLLGAPLILVNNAGSLECNRSKR